jgi:hypothetical protein
MGSLNIAWYLCNGWRWSFPCRRVEDDDIALRHYV